MLFLPCSEGYEAGLGAATRRWSDRNTPPGRALLGFTVVSEPTVVWIVNGAAVVAGFANVVLKRARSNSCDDLGALLES